MAEGATKADLAATKADPHAAIELARWRVKVKLVGILIANLVAIGLFLWAVVALFAP